MAPMMSVQLFQASAASYFIAGAWPAAKQVVRLPGDYVSPAAALWIGAHMWAYLSPHSYHVMQCLAASVPVMAGYAQTKRAAATGRLAAGEPLLLGGGSWDWGG